VAVELQARLAERGHHSVFLDFDPENGIPAGRNWERELYARLRSCQAVIALCSVHSTGSQWCFAEITQARALGKHLIPIKLDGCRLPSVLTDVQVIDLTKDAAEAWQRLFAGLTKAGLDPSKIFDWDPTRPPYPGLMAFQEQDAAVYFGRDEAIQSGVECLNRLQRLGRTRWMLILGASGSGKSSLARAGILPRLQRDPELWLVLDPFRPMHDAFDEFASAWAAAFAGSAPRDWRTIRAALESTRDGTDARAILQLANDLRFTTGRREASVLVVVDQFEELLRAHEPVSAAGFLRLLRAATEQPGTPLIVVATLRSDFLGSLQPSAFTGSSRESAPRADGARRARGHRGRRGSQVWSSGRGL
jgi:hypothetical protein